MLKVIPQSKLESKPRGEKEGQPQQPIPTRTPRFAVGQHVTFEREAMWVVRTMRDTYPTHYQLGGFGGFISHCQGNQLTAGSDGLHSDIDSLFSTRYQIVLWKSY